MTRPQRGQRTPDAADQGLSRASAARLSLYLRCLETWRSEDVATVSSSQLADALGLRDAQVRKDIGHLGSLGQPGIGYKVPELIAAIRRALGINREWRTLIVGVGNLARALLRYRGFREQGFEIVGLFDIDPDKIGQKLEGLTIRPVGELPRTIAQASVELAVLTVPAEAAQPVADALASAGIRGILNFAPTVLRLPATVRLVNVDLAIQLEQLAFQVAFCKMEG